MADSEISMASPSPSLTFDADLLRKFDQHGSCYAFYPTVNRFSANFGASDYVQAVTSMRSRSGSYPLSLYLRMPFWKSGCHLHPHNKTIKLRNKVTTYLRYLNQEIELQGKLFAGLNRVDQLHFGGGTSSPLSENQMDELLLHLRKWFSFASDEKGEYSIDVDTCNVRLERIHALRNIGFNHVRFTLQEFNTNIKQMTDRSPPENSIGRVVSAAREAHFRSISIDLIIGVPKQNIISIAQMLVKIIEASPDRIAIYSYAQLPHPFKMARQIDQPDLPSADATLDMLFLCTKRLTEAQYVYVGMDYFAKSGDALVLAQQQGRLYRNSQGYSTIAEVGLVSCGVSAIGAIGATYSQNEMTLHRYYKRVAQGELPIARGKKLTMDDLLRRIIIKMLISTFQLSIASIELGYPINFASYFSREVEELRALEDEGLLEIDAEWLTVTLKGRLLIRNICMVFDSYLHDKPALTIV